MELFLILHQIVFAVECLCSEAGIKKQTVEEKESLFARHRLDLIELISVFKENFY